MGDQIPGRSYILLNYDLGVSFLFVGSHFITVFCGGDSVYKDPGQLLIGYMSR